MVEKVLVRNRKTGIEKEVPPKVAEMMQNEDFLKKDWEVVKPGSPTPHTVIQYQEKLEKGEELQPVVVEFEKKDDPDAEIKKAEAIIEAAKKRKIELEAEQKAKKEADENAKEDLSVVSVKKLADRMEYLTPEQLEGLKTDIRVSVVRMVDKELKKREDEKSNQGSK